MSGQDPYIYLSEAGRLSGYTAEYLRQLCVGGKLEGHRLGKNWVTTASAVERFKRGDQSPPTALRHLTPASLPSSTKLQRTAATVLALAIFLPVAANLVRLPDRINWARDKTNSFVVSTEDLVNQKAQEWLKNQLRTLGLRPEAKSGGTNHESASAASRSEPRASSSSTGQVLGTSITKLSDDDFIASLRSVISAGLPDDLALGLKGDKGDTGPAGPASQYIPNTQLVYAVTAPGAQYPGSIGSVTYGSSKEFYTQTLTVSSDISQTGGSSTLRDTSIIGTLSVSGDSSFEGIVNLSGNLLPSADDTYSIGSGVLRFQSLNIGAGFSVFDGDLTVNGNTTLNGLTITNDSFTSNDQSTFTKVPTLPHVFALAWPTGASNASDGTLYINPASSIADGNLISAAVDGNIQFLVDAEGDIGPIKTPLGVWASSQPLTRLADIL